MKKLLNLKLVLLIIAIVMISVFALTATNCPADPDPCYDCENYPCECPSITYCEDCEDYPCTCPDVCADCQADPCTCTDACPDCDELSCVCIFTVVFIVNEDGITAPQSLTPNINTGFMLPTVEKQGYILRWQIYGTTNQFAPNTILQFASHNTPVDGTLTLVAIFTPPNPLLATANGIRDDVLEMGLSLPQNQITERADASVELTIAGRIGASTQQVWGEPIGDVTIIVFQTEAEAIYEAEGALASMTSRFENIIVRSSTAFTRWFFATMLDLGTPGRVTNAAGTAVLPEFNTQRAAIRTEMYRHLQRTDLPPGFTYRQDAVIRNTRQDPTRLLVEFSNG